MITTAALSQTHRDAARDLLDAVTAHDGVAPLDEAARLAITGGNAQHLLLEREPTGQAGADATGVNPADADADADAGAAGEADDDRLIGYASVLADGTVQGMVHPAHRRRGHGTALLQAALGLHDEPGVWAHGALDGSLAFLSAAGLQETRRLLTLHRRLDADHPAAAVPAPRLEGLHLDSFDVDRDADRWVQVNALAFADHPEQGALTRTDLDQRMAESWFDPEDMVVARRQDELVGFVWIKREAPEQGADRAATPVDAEIYVVATDPSVQGHGVAGFLLAAALDRLQATGVPGVELYVEADNTPALRLYETWGFTVSGRDVQMRPTGKG